MENVFNIRVYGLVVNDKMQVLISDEHVYGRNITKFPGGGLQFGEGTVECLKREFMEELQTEIKVLSHFYTTDFFQQSFLNPKHQVISIYYLTEIINPSMLKTTAKPFDFDKAAVAMHSFRWISLADAREEDVTFPIDRKVISMLKKQFEPA